jgi:hypothetical protein
MLGMREFHSEGRETTYCHPMTSSPRRWSFGLRTLFVVVALPADSP